MYGIISALEGRCQPTIPNLLRLWISPLTHGFQSWITVGCQRKAAPGSRTRTSSALRYVAHRWASFMLELASVTSLSYSAFDHGWRPPVLYMFMKLLASK